MCAAASVVRINIRVGVCKDSMPAERKILQEHRVEKMYLYSFFSAGRYIYLYIYIYELWVYGPALVPARWLIRSVAALVPFGRLRTVGGRCRLFNCQGAAGMKNPLIYP